MPCPTMSHCRITCGHYQKVRDYQQERERQEADAWEQAFGYDAEFAELRGSLITFRRWLEGSRAQIMG